MERIVPNRHQPELATHQDHLGHFWEELPSGAWRVYFSGKWVNCENPPQTAWPLSNRIDIIATNGNTGEHYDVEALQKEVARLKAIMAMHLDAWHANDIENIQFTIDEMEKVVK